MGKLLNTTGTKPEILTHPHIPHALHGVNPRTIMGKSWWEQTRVLAIQAAKHRCVSCGVHKARAKKHRWLEVHEYFDINYQTGRCEVVSLEPLCHYCHNFIHSGRLSLIVGEEKSDVEVIAILEHGFKILADHHLQCFPFTLEFAKQLGANYHGVSAYHLSINTKLTDADIVLVFEGKEYRKCDISG